jgi:ABC-2 type transport system permease protein
MNTRGWATLTKCEAKMVVRDTAGLVVPIALPMMVLVMNASSAGAAQVANGRTALDVFVLPLIFTVVLASIGMVNMPGFLAYYRRSGILRRLAVTPASPVMVLVAQMVVSVAQAVLGIGLAFALALLAFGAQLPVNGWATLGVVALAITALYAVGMVVASLAPTPNSAVAIGLVGFFVLGAVGGMFGGTNALPGPVARIGEWLPFGATVDALSSTWAGWPVNANTLIALAATTVIGVAVSAVYFRWE